jgi:MalT-like TPR region
VLDYKTQPVLEILDQALVLFRQVQDEFGVTRSLMTMGQVYEGISERGLASRYYLESLQKFRQAGDQRGVAYLNHRLGWLAKWYGDLGVAEAHFEESLAIGRQFGAYNMVYNLLGLGECAYRRGKYAQAIQYLGEANLLNSRMGNREIEVCILYALGNIERLEGNYGNAREMLSQALALSQEYGLIKDSQLTLGYLAKVDCSLGNYHQAALRMEQALKTRANMDTYQEIYLENLEAIIIYAFAVQKNSRAAQLWGAVEAYRQSKEMVRYPVDAAEIEPIRQGLQARLGEEGFAEAYAQGQSLTLEQAVRQAQEMLGKVKSDTALPASDGA